MTIEEALKQVNEVFNSDLTEENRKIRLHDIFISFIESNKDSEK